MRSPARILSGVTLLILWHGFAPAALHAQRLDWKLEDFQPLTELPWDEAGKMPLSEVLTAIFREPDPQIRHPVLAAYLRRIPVEQFGAAFDQCIIMEGTQTPHRMVSFLVRIWAERDPKACWERTRALFQVIGVKYGWLNYDSWKRRDKITVRDAKAIHASRFWLENENYLLDFPVGVEASSLPEAEKVKMFRVFADAWFETFQSWPGYQHAQEGGSKQLLAAFASTPQSMRESFRSSSGQDYEAAVEVGLRRWLKAEPKAALEILEKKHELIPAEYDAANGSLLPNGPSTAWLMLWRQLDLPAMVRWAESPDGGVRERGMLMSWVDEPTRHRWLETAEKDSNKEQLIGVWASWNPQPGVEAAVATRQSGIVLEAFNSAAYGPFQGVWNTCHPGLGFVRNFDIQSRIKDFMKDLRDTDWGTAIMEQWGDVDVGEAARYGLDFMLKTDYASREELIKLFSGDDDFASDADMLDRTFCALRVWAVTKPDEMKTWIATLKEEDLRKALTWLLENPWGTGPEE
ncbi:hypothetical protein [Roseimicrobium sp. ORNL1]|uniref:hypothetical protein n=1 Tax=Roseimicrobium sp. ORNL1 TaxID=2711231 RepID=UPI0013E0FEFF|nr:hypothetical protein [Roseimicrobium sp. ORNL1]QIF01674.1 hypothetical protein G5S37_09110 [Roseimicrobium sp. ORNL1]